MLFVPRTCFNEFLSLLDVAWVNKVLLLLLQLRKLAVKLLIFCRIFLRRVFAALKSKMAERPPFATRLPLICRLFSLKRDLKQLGVDFKRRNVNECEGIFFY